MTVLLPIIRKTRQFQCTTFVGLRVPNARHPYFL